MGWLPRGRGQKPAVGGMGQGGFLALSVCLKEGAFVCYLCN